MIKTQLPTDQSELTFDVLNAVLGDHVPGVTITDVKITESHQ